MVDRGSNASGMPVPPLRTAYLWPDTLSEHVGRFTGTCPQVGNPLEHNPQSWKSGDEIFFLFFLNLQLNQNLDHEDLG